MQRATSKALVSRMHMMVAAICSPVVAGGHLCLQVPIEAQYNYFAFVLFYSFGPYGPANRCPVKVIPNAGRSYVPYMAPGSDCVRIHGVGEPLLRAEGNTNQLNGRQPRVLVAMKTTAIVTASYKQSNVLVGCIDRSRCVRGATHRYLLTLRCPRSQAVRIFARPSPRQHLQGK